LGVVGAEQSGGGGGVTTTTVVNLAHNNEAVRPSATALTSRPDRCATSNKMQNLPRSRMTR